MLEPETNSKENGDTCLQCFYLLISVNFPSFYYIFFFLFWCQCPMVLRAKAALKRGFGVSLLHLSINLKFGRDFFQACLYFMSSI